MSRKRTGDAPSRRPEPVKLRRAGIGGTPRQGIKNTPTRQPEKAAREHGGDPSSGCGIGRRLRRRPPTSQRRPQRSRRSPELHHWLKRTRDSRKRTRRRSAERGDFAKKNTTISRKRTGDAPSRRPEPVKLRRAGIGGTPRQGIKNTPTRQPEKAAREHGGDPSSGCGIGRRLRRRPPTSQRRPQRSRRSPELHHWLKRTRRCREKEPAMRPAGGPSRSNCAAPELAAPAAKG